MHDNLVSTSLLKMVFCIILFISTYHMDAQTLSEFEQDSIISIYYGKLDKATSDSIKSRTFDFQSYDQELFFKSLFTISGPYFYRKEWNSIASDIKLKMDQDLPSKKYDLTSIVKKELPYLYRSCIANIWDNNTLSFFALPNEQEDANKRLQSLLEESLSSKPSDLVRYNELIKNSGTDSVCDFYYNHFSGELRPHIIYLWLIKNYKYSNPEIIERDILYFQKALDEDLKCSNYQMAEYYLALAKIYNFLDFYKYFQQSMYALAKADAYLDEEVNFEEKLSLLSIRAELISNIPGYFSKQQARDLIGTFYSRNKITMSYDQKMRTLTQLCKHWGEFIEIKNVDGIGDGLAINYISFCYETSKYHWEDNKYYGLLAHSNLITFNHLERRYSRCTQYAYDCLAKFPFDLDYSSSILATAAVAADIVKNKKYTDLNDFITLLIKEENYDIEKINTIRQVLKEYEANKIFEKLVKKITDNPNEYGEFLYSLNYAFRGSRFFESILSKKNDYWNQLDSLELINMNALSTSFAMEDGQKILREPSMNYYGVKALKILHIHESNRFFIKKKWKRAYHSLVSAYNLTPKLTSEPIFNLGYTFGWSSSKKEERELKISRQTLVSTNQRLSNENYEIKEENEYVEFINLLLKSENKKFETIIKDRELQLLSLDYAIKSKTKELKDSVKRLGNVLALNEKLDEATTRALVNSIKAARQEALAKGESRQAKQLMWSVTAVSILTIGIAIAFRKQKIRAKKSEKEAIDQKERAQKSEQKVKLISETMRQLGHIAPHSISPILSKISRSSEIYNPLKILKEILHGFHGRYTKEKILLEDELDLVEDLINIKYIDYGSDDLFDRVHFNEEAFYGVLIPNFTLMNLILNAFEHGTVVENPNGKVDIHMTEDGDFYSIKVSNEFSPDKKSRVGTNSGLKFISSALKVWNSSSEEFIEHSKVSCIYTSTIRFKNKNGL